MPIQLRILAPSNRYLTETIHPDIGVVFLCSASGLRPTFIRPTTSKDGIERIPSHTPNTSQGQGEFGFSLPHCIIALGVNDDVDLYVMVIDAIVDTRRREDEIGDFDLHVFQGGYATQVELEFDARSSGIVQRLHKVRYCRRILPYQLVIIAGN